MSKLFRLLKPPIVWLGFGKTLLHVWIAHRERRRPDGNYRDSKRSNHHCKLIRRSDLIRYKKELELTCTISNFVPKPFTPFQWFAQVPPAEMERKHKLLRQYLKDSGLRHVTLNMTDSEISLLESAISRGDRSVGSLILEAYRNGAVFDAWDDKFQPKIWQAAAKAAGTPLEDLA